MDAENKWAACITLIHIFKSTPSGEKLGRSEMAQLESAFGSMSDDAMMKRAAKCEWMIANVEMLLMCDVKCPSLGFIAGVDEIRSSISNDHWTQILKRLPASSSLTSSRTRKPVKRGGRMKKHGKAVSDEEEAATMFGDSLQVLPPNVKMR